MRDNRDPEALGMALAKLKELHPDISAAERADMLDESYRISWYATASNGKLNDSANS